MSSRMRQHQPQPRGGVAWRSERECIFFINIMIILIIIIYNADTLAVDAFTWLSLSASRLMMDFPNTSSNPIPVAFAIRPFLHAHQMLSVFALFVIGRPARAPLTASTPEPVNFSIGLMLRMEFVWCTWYKWYAQNKKKQHIMVRLITKRLIK